MTSERALIGLLQIFSGTLAAIMYNIIYFFTLEQFVAILGIFYRDETTFYIVPFVYIPITFALTISLFVFVPRIKLLAVVFFIVGVVYMLYVNNSYIGF